MELAVLGCRRQLDFETAADVDERVPRVVPPRDHAGRRRRGGDLDPVLGANHVRELTPQRATAARRRCSGVQPSPISSGSPVSAVMTPERSRATAYCFGFTWIGMGEPYRCARARRPRRDRIHGRAHLRRSAPTRHPAPARRPAPGGTRGNGPGRGNSRRGRARRRLSGSRVRGRLGRRLHRRPVPRNWPRARGRGDSGRRPLPRHERRTGLRAHRVRAVRARGRSARRRAAHLVRLRLRARRPGRAPGGGRARAGAGNRSRLRRLRHEIEPRHPALGGADHATAARGLERRAARPLPLRRHFAEGDVPVRRARGGRVGRNRATLRAATHGRPGRALLRQSPANRGTLRAGHGNRRSAVPAQRRGGSEDPDEERRAKRRSPSWRKRGARRGRARP